MDPHTSVAQAVVEAYSKQKDSQRPILICSTAHFAKFPDAISRALSQRVDPDSSDEFAIIQKVAKLFPQTSLPRNIIELQEKPVLHTTKFNASAEGVMGAVVTYLRR